MQKPVPCASYLHGFFLNNHSFTERIMACSDFNWELPLATSVLPAAAYCMTFGFVRPAPCYPLLEAAVVKSRDCSEIVVVSKSTIFCHSKSPW